MAATVSNTATYQNNGSVATTFNSGNITVAANEILVAFAMYQGDSPTITAVKWNGAAEAFTATQANVDDSGGVLAQNSCWVLHNPTATTAQVQGTSSAVGGGYQGLFVISIAGADNSSSAACHRAAAHGTSSVNVTSVSGDLVLGCTASYKISTTPAASGGSTLIGSAIQEGASNYWFAAEQQTASGTSTTMSFSTDGLDTTIGMAIVPAAGGGGGGGQPFAIRGAWILGMHGNGRVFQK